MFIEIIFNFDETRIEITGIWNLITNTNNKLFDGVVEHDYKYII